MATTAEFTLLRLGPGLRLVPVATARRRRRMRGDIRAHRMGPVPGARPRRGARLLRPARGGGLRPGVVVPARGPGREHPRRGTRAGAHRHRPVRRHRPGRDRFEHGAAVREPLRPRRLRVQRILVLRPRLSHRRIRRHIIPIHCPGRTPNVWNPTQWRTPFPAPPGRPRGRAALRRAGGPRRGTGGPGVLQRHAPWRPAARGRPHALVRAARGVRASSRVRNAPGVRTRLRPAQSADVDARRAQGAPPWSPPA